MKDSIWIKKGHFTLLAIICMVLLPLLTALICLCFGRMNVSVQSVIQAFKDALSGTITNAQNYSIVINLRLPRILMAIIVGAGLTCAGNTFQSLFSNPLATPDILGVTSGTCVGAILAIILSCSMLETQLIALAFGLVSVLFTLKIAGKNDGRSMVYLVLAGTIASSLFNAIGSLLKYTADPQDKLPEITYWLMGSFTSASYQKILIGCPLILIGIVMIYLLRWRLNILSLSDDEAKVSGINIKQTRMIFIIASTLITASSVSMCSQVGWIGLLPWKSGNTFLYGKDLHTLKSKDIWSKISYIPQSHGFAFSYTGLEMVLLGRSAHLGLFEQPGKAEIEMAEQMMERVGITHLANKDCNKMSGSELQMVLIARALINDPKLIILDEPETGLVFYNQILILTMIERLAHYEGICAIINTHYPTNAMSIADEALMLNRKGNFLYGKASDVLTAENISNSFDVNVVVNELNYEGRTIRSIVPVSLRKDNQNVE